MTRLPDLTTKPRFKRTGFLKTRIASVSAAALTACIFLPPGSADAAYRFSVVYALQGFPDGEYPTNAGLVRDSAGNLYGATEAGGANNSGALFKVAPNGTETVAYSLNGSTDGADVEGLVLGGRGNLYGTTAIGGIGSCDGGDGCGTVFELGTGGTYTVLHDFSGYSIDGAQPEGGLLKAAGGLFYGTAAFGGTSECSDFASGCGVIYEISDNGPEAVRYTFQGGADGALPIGTPVADSSGNLYGTTVDGGTGCGCGTIWKFAADGTETVLYSFSNGNDGGYSPTAGLAKDAAGNLYGTAGGGGSGGGGTVFKLAPDGTLTVLHAFTGGSDGEIPSGPLVVDPKGNVYGETVYGGGGTGCSGSSCGTVFEITPNGLYGVIYRFSGGADGGYPVGGLIRSGGSLYGVAEIGGVNFNQCGGTGCGTVFKLTP